MGERLKPTRPVVPCIATDLPDDGATLMYDVHDELFWRVSHEGDRVELYDRPTESVARLDNIVYEVGAQGARLTRTMQADFEWCKRQHSSGDGTDAPDDWPPSHQCVVDWPGGHKY